MSRKVTIPITALEYIIEGAINQFYDSNGKTLSSANRERFVFGVIAAIEKAKRDNIIEDLSEAKKVLKEVTELFHLQESKEWEYRATQIIFNYKHGQEK